VSGAEDSTIFSLSAKFDSVSESKEKGGAIRALPFHSTIQMSLQSGNQYRESWLPFICT
jgi:hypothetical protein